MLYRMQFVRRTLLLVLVAAAAQAAPQTTDRAAKTLRVLFVGNSYTYYNNLPEMFSSLAQAARPQLKVETKMVTRGGATLEQMWDMGTARNAIRESRWDYVVLQEQSLLGYSLLNGAQVINEPQFFWRSVREFDEEIKRTGARTVLYLTWARETTPERQPDLSYAYFTIGREIQAVIAPVGLAWQHIRSQEAPFRLHDIDGSHPSPAGSYLAACTLAYTILGEVHRNLPATVFGHPITTSGIVDMTRLASLVSLQPEQAERLQSAAALAFQEVREAGGYLSLTPPNPPPTLALPTGRRAQMSDLRGLWAGKLKYFQSPATMELRLDSDPAGCRAQWTVSLDGGRSRQQQIATSCRLTSYGIEFIISDMRGLNFYDQYRGAFQGETLTGTVNFVGPAGTRMLGTWELRRQP